MWNTEIFDGLEAVPLLIEGYVCLTHAVWSLKSKNDFTDTGILSSAGHNCEIVYNHDKYLLLHMLPVQHLTVLVLIWWKKKNKGKKKAS